MHHNSHSVIVEYLRQTTSELISPDLWPPNSRDLKRVDYKICSCLQDWVYQRRVRDVDELNSVWLQITDCIVLYWLRHGQTLGRPPLMRPSMSGKIQATTSVQAREGTSIQTLVVNGKPNVHLDDMFYCKTWSNILELFYWILLALRLLWERISWFQVLTITSLILCCVISCITRFHWNWMSLNYQFRIYSNCKNVRFFWDTV